MKNQVATTNVYTVSLQG